MYEQVVIVTFSGGTTDGVRSVLTNFLALFLSWLEVMYSDSQIGMVRSKRPEYALCGEGDLAYRKMFLNRKEKTIKFTALLLNYSACMVYGREFIRKGTTVFK